MQLAQNGTVSNYWQDPGGFYIEAMVKTLFTKEEQAEYIAAVIAFDHCFQLAKQQKMKAADIAYAACAGISSSISTSLLDWIMAFYGQRLCYYHYRSKNYEEGIVLTQEITKSVSKLQQNGHQFLFFVDIQQRLNLSRIYFAMNDAANAIALCSACVRDMYNNAGTAESRQLINGIPEQELIRITQYGMIVEVLTTTCNQLLAATKDEEWLERTTLAFIEPLLQFDFTAISPEPCYSSINKFIALLAGLTGYAELRDSDVLFFMSSPYADKKMLMVLNKYIGLVEV